MAEPKPSRSQINIELPANLPMTYANFALINHTPSEILIDLAQLLPNVPVARVQARILMTPLNAKLLYHALGENLAHYEAHFGPIPGFDEAFRQKNVLGGLEWRMGAPDAPPSEPPSDKPKE